MPRRRSGSRPAQENADRGSEEIRDNLGFLQTFLLVFGFIAVFVGSFLIFNTFSITVAQRVSEFGMLRTLGASRRQILSSVLVEALAIGLVGAVLGIGGGFLVALLLNALFERLRHRPADDRPGAGVADGDRRAAGRRPRHPRLLAGPGAALDPGAADRRPARLRSRRRAGAAGSLFLALSIAARRRPASALVLLGLFGSGERRRRGRADRRRRRRRRLRRLALQPAPGAAAGDGRRLAAGAAARASPAASRARTPSATRAAPRSPRRR